MDGIFWNVTKTLYPQIWESQQTSTKHMTNCQKTVKILYVQTNKDKYDNRCQNQEMQGKDSRAASLNYWEIKPINLEFYNRNFS